MCIRDSLTSHSLTLSHWWHRMQSDPVAFCINKDTHVSIVRTDLCFGYDHLSSCCFNPVQDDLYIGITIEIDERAMRFRRLIKPFGIANGASDRCV